MNEENITNEELLKAVKEGFKTLEDRVATKEEMSEGFRDIRANIKELQEGAFTKNEKEEVLDMVRHYDQQLKKDALGVENITLTRAEYDNVAKTSGFENRFEKIGK